MEIYILFFFIFLFGISIGSFLNVVIYRVPKDESIIFPSSKCQSCHVKLKWWHNIPLLSWIFLKGKCYFCSAKISIQYPIIELITGFIIVILFFKFGLTVQFFTSFIIFSMLLILSAIDIEYMAVPDNINLLALFVAGIQINFIPVLGDILLIVGGATLLRYYLNFFLNKDTMGEGDIILAGTMAGLLSFPLVFYAFFLSSILALIPVLLAKDKIVPFIPFLSIATFIVYIYDIEFLKIHNSLY